MIQRFGRVAVALLCMLGAVSAHAQYVTLTGTLSAANGLPAVNDTISLTPSQIFFIAGTGVSVNSTVECSTSTDGSVVGTPNPLQPPQLSSSFSGTLPSGNYYVEIAWYDAATHTTLISPEAVIQLTGPGTLTVAIPTTGIPATAAGMTVYIGTSSGSETSQGTTTGAANFVQSTPLATGTAAPPTNTTICKIIANDAGFPTGTGYTASLTDPSGNTYPGYPMMWQLNGVGTTINLSSGIPYYHGIVYYPTPIMASPLNHATQSISGPLSLTSYNLINVGRVGVGTAVPAWGLDLEGSGASSQANASGYLVGGSGGTSGQCLASDGTAFDTEVPCITSIGSIYYQAITQNVTTHFTPREGLDFSTIFKVTDDGGTINKTSIDINNAGPTGSYTCGNFTVNAYGMLTAASNGSCSGVWQAASAAGCATAVSDGSTCTTTVTWPVAFADSNYIPVCTGLGPTSGSTSAPAFIGLTGLQSISAANVVVITGSFGSGQAASYATIYCIAHHN